ncbi:MAG TPA: glycosyltransferase family 61 protein [Ramlibacter sp.]|uniref:glycosyltransferase family 61 protein n=1 Tax=Ramlibacter sp. TaxID=1917967 RepID=UPI002D80445E|nr:glycosyltransferase family 61 protein [Ramlibacter sp.]HET8744035.1 glycosyltransferase family 61 protein [Ramlibacter sp.]
MRKPKEALWFAFWYTRWHVVRPLARAVVPHRLLRSYHAVRGLRWRSLARIWSDRPLPMVQYSAAALPGQAGVRRIFPAATVRSERPDVHPPSLRSLVASRPESYTFPDVSLHRWRSAEVVAKSNMIVVGGRVVHHDLYRFTSDYTSEELHGRMRILPARHAVRRLEEPNVRVHLAHAAAFTDSCSANYAHWLTEVLPRLHAYACAGLPEDATILLDAGLHANLLASAELVLGKGARFHMLEPGTAATVDLLDVVSPGGYIPFDRRGEAQPGDSHGVFSPPTLRSMRDRLSALLGEGPGGTPAKVLIRRKSGNRALVNEDALEERLAPLGFVPVYPERLSFAEQFHLFSNVETVVGATGAAMANLIFCRPSARIVICLSALPHHIYGYWQNMAQAVGCRVKYVLGPVAGAKGAGIHADFSVDVNDVLAAVQTHGPNASKEAPWHSATAD